jgi:hypothetical protein
MHHRWQKGDRVFAWWTSGQFLWYPATIESVEADLYQVRFDDGDFATVPPDQLRPLEVSEGSRVQSRWKAGSEYYCGIIDGKEGSKIHVAYDDGDQEWTTIEMLRMGGSVPPSAKGYLAWTNPDAGKDKPSLVRLSADALTVATVPKEDLGKVVAALAEGAPVAGQVIPLSTLVKVEGAEDGPALNVSYHSETGQTEEVTVTFVDPGAREGLLGALSEQLGSTWQRSRRATRRWSSGFWTALVAPLILIAAVAFFTWLGYTEAQAIAAGMRPAEVKGGRGRIRWIRMILRDLEEGIGATGILLLGGFLMVLALWWLCYTLTHLPGRTVLEPVTDTYQT